MASTARRWGVTTSSSKWQLAAGSQAVETQCTTVPRGALQTDRQGGWVVCACGQPGLLIPGACLPRRSRVGKLEQTVYAGEDKEHKAYVKLSTAAVRLPVGREAEGEGRAARGGREGAARGCGAAHRGAGLRPTAGWLAGVLGGWGWSALPSTAHCRAREQAAARQGMVRLTEERGQHAQHVRTHARLPLLFRAPPPGCAVSCRRARCCTRRPPPSARRAACICRPRASLRWGPGGDEAVSAC